jgi:hypothetical protein
MTRRAGRRKAELKRPNAEKYLQFLSRICDPIQGRQKRYERSQMITTDNGRPIPNDPPMINAIAKSKPNPARNSCQGMPLLLQARCPRII